LCIPAISNKEKSHLLVVNQTEARPVIMLVHFEVLDRLHVPKFPIALHNSQCTVSKLSKPLQFRRNTPKEVEENPSWNIKQLIKYKPRERDN